MHDVHTLIADERRMIGGLRVADGPEAAYLLGYADALDFALDIIAHRGDDVPADELRAAMRGPQLAQTLSAATPR
jgi:hypothetical protein